MKLNGRKVVDIEIDDINPKDYPDFCDAMIVSANFEDTGEMLTEDQLEELVESNRDEFHELVHEAYVSRFC